MMRFLRLFVLLLCLMASFAVTRAQGVLSDVGGSIGIGNVQGISRYFDHAVALSIAGSNSTYSKSQAEMILRDFFSKNPPRGFQMEQSGDNNSIKFAIGTLITSSGNYRSYFVLKQKEGGYMIQEIRFEK